MLSDFLPQADNVFYQRIKKQAEVLCSACQGLQVIGYMNMSICVLAFKEDD